MACNSSKREDVRRDRQRRNINSGQQQYSQNNQNSNFSNVFNAYSSNINIPNQKHSASNHSNNIYGTSYTNRKTAEFELLNDIVRATRGNFIDQSNLKSTHLDLHSRNRQLSGNQSADLCQSQQHYSDERFQEEEMIQNELEQREKLYADKLKRHDEQLHRAPLLVQTKGKYRKDQVVTQAKQPPTQPVDEFEFINRYRQSINSASTEPLSPEFSIQPVGQLVLSFDAL